MGRSSSSLAASRFQRVLFNTETNRRLWITRRNLARSGSSFDRVRLPIFLGFGVFGWRWFDPALLHVEGGYFERPSVLHEIDGDRVRAVGEGGGAGEVESRAGTCAGVDVKRIERHVAHRAPRLHGGAGGGKRLHAEAGRAIRGGGGEVAGAEIG